MGCVVGGGVGAGGRAVLDGEVWDGVAEGARGVGDGVDDGDGGIFGKNWQRHY